MKIGFNGFLGIHNDFEGYIYHRTAERNNYFLTSIIVLS